MAAIVYIGTDPKTSWSPIEKGGMKKLELTPLSVYPFTFTIPTFMC